MFAEFRADPVAHKLKTPSGLIEIFSTKIAGFGYQECPGYPVWREPAEWLGRPDLKGQGMHLISDQPRTKLHSQLDHSSHSRAAKVAEREALMIHPDDARLRSIETGDIVRVHNARGNCLAGVIVSEEVMPGVVRMSTGAWWDPDSDRLDKHGNANVLTRDVGASRLSQGCAAQTCIVEVERFQGLVPPLTAYQRPTFDVSET
jgi:biotin/methionine sulfoxide reductase